MTNDSTFLHQSEDFGEYDDVTRFLDSLKEEVSETAVNSILNFSKAYRVMNLEGSSRRAEVIIN